METTEIKTQFNGGYKLHNFEEVESLYDVYISNLKDREMIRTAYEYILQKHEGQYRRSGEPYYHHLVEVCYILATLQCGPVTLCAGLLHDVVEDTNTPLKEIENKFGKDVAKIVDSLTKIQRLKLSKISKEEFEAEDHMKIFLGMAQDVRVIIVKLADRLHNMRTLDSLTKDRQLIISRETLDVFVPIAHRLGINVIKSELEDLSLKYLEPDKYQEISKLLSNRFKTRKKSLDALAKRIADILFEHNIPFDIKTRIKSIYSIYEKMYHKGKKFDEIYDVLALRIITKTDLQCYEILGLIHQTYRPIPGRFKDYIAMPKPNLYQSLHTSIVSGDGNIYEVQIRTEKMDDVAESGVAAHWAYKEGSYNSQKEQREIENQLHWFRDFVSMSDHTDGDAQEYMESLTNDIFGANVYVFTPKGKVVELPRGATCLDFAYRIHTKVGESTVGALINNLMVPLNTKLKTGDVCEIKTSKNAPGPNEKWLDFVVSHNAKSAIKKYLFKKNAAYMRQENINKGKNICIDGFRDRGITSESEIIKYIDKKDVFNHFNVNDLDELFLSVSNKEILPSNLADYLGLKKITSLPTFKNNKVSNDDDCPVYCKGVGKIMINLASCCNPIPGDQIVGYITRGKGISVHRINCPNIAKEKLRLVNVYWRDDLQNKKYQVDISLDASDRTSLLNDVMSALASQNIMLTAINAKLNTQTLITTITATIHVENAKKLENVFSLLLSLKGVINVSRVIH